LNIIDYLSLALDSIKERKGRSIGAITGIIIGVSALSIALGIGSSFNREFSQRLMRVLSSDIIYIIPNTKLSETDVLLVSDLPNVEEVIPIASAQVIIEGGEKIGTTIYGIKPGQIRYILGTDDPKKALLDGHITLLGNNVLVGELIAIDYERGIKRFEVGQNIVVRGDRTHMIGTIEGIIKSTGVSIAFIRPGASIFVNLETFFQYFNPSRSYDIIVVKVQDVNKIDETSDRIKAYLPDATVVNLSFLLEQFNMFMRSVEIFLAFISGVSLLITGLWMFDTMTISVIQRTREIGVLKALGFRRRQLMTMFLSESFLLSIMGSFIGILVFLVLSEFVGIPAFDITLKPEMDVKIVSLTFVIPVIINIVATLAPAYTAAKLDPVEALRYE